MGDGMNEHVLLEMKNISKRFPGVKALHEIDFTLYAGEIHALLGENGAGKSTLIKVLGGIYIPEEGEIYINGKHVIIDGVKAAQENGIAIIHQELVLVPYMTVAENIFLGKERGKSFFINESEMFDEAQKLLDAYEMNIRADALINQLSIAQQQMVEIVKAMSFETKILVMDEPTSSISDKEVAFLFEKMRFLADQGVGIIYISHKMSELNEICDRVTVMRDGQYVGTEVVKETTRNHLITMMVGRELTNYYTRTYQEPGDVVLKCEHICDDDIVKDVSFALRKGEILGFAGLIGAGRSELMKCIFGLQKNMSGGIYMDGQPVKIKNPEDAMKHGIALVPENRKLEGIYDVQSVRFNSTIEVLSQFIRGVAVNENKEDEITQHYIDMMATKTPSMDQMISKLSGGNQQKVMIGRWLATRPKILILDEPTRGVDVGAKAEIYTIMNQLVQQGMSIIMISSELPEILNMSDRIYVMCNGAVTGCFSHEESVTQEQIMTLAAQ